MTMAGEDKSAIKVSICVANRQDAKTGEIFSKALTTRHCRKRYRRQNAASSVHMTHTQMHQQ